MMENDSDATRIGSLPLVKKTTTLVPIRIHYLDQGNRKTRVFNKTFTLGRSNDCGLVIAEKGISRHHAKIELTASGWVLKDLNSSNGTYVNGNKIQQIPLTDHLEFFLGDLNSPLTVAIEQPIEKRPIQSNTPSQIEEATVLSSQQANSLQNQQPAQVFEHYFADRPEDEMGEHTRLVRKIIKQEQQKVEQKTSSRYRLIIVVVIVLLLFSGGLISYQQYRLNKAKSIAVDMFYDIKGLEVQLAQNEMLAEHRQNKGQRSDIASKRQKLKAMKARYQDYLNELDFENQFRASLSPEDAAIVRMAQVFGECDLQLPDEFITEVKKYIVKWQSSQRLVKAIARLERLGHVDSVVKTMRAAGLPPQLLYISLQESDFRFDAIGPKTRFGIAKGAWQFIPSTGREYGLKIGPLAAYREHDPDDERFDFEKSSRAAAKYLKKIYSMEAQASGLLVIASYNWGHNRVRRLINKMPDNPQERNFWKLTQHYKMPKETYDYVFYIFSAAVITENPTLFGFDFKNPMLSALKQGDMGTHVFS